LCYHIWESYKFSGSKVFLERLFPVLKGCVQFLVDFLVEDSSGTYLVTNPSLSPENTYFNKHGKPGVLCEGSAIDIQIIDAIFEAYIESSFELGVSNDLLETVERCRVRLPPMRIGSLGQLQEWQHDYKEAEPGMYILD
jgi:hypothetical protein